MAYISKLSDKASAILNALFSQMNVTSPRFEKVSNDQAMCENYGDEKFNEVFGVI